MFPSIKTLFLVVLIIIAWRCFQNAISHMQDSAKLATTLAINKPIHTRQTSFLAGKVGKEELNYLLSYPNILKLTSQDTLLLKYPFYNYINKKKEEMSVSALTRDEIQSSKKTKRDWEQPMSNPTLVLTHLSSVYM